MDTTQTNNWKKLFSENISESSYINFKNIKNIASVVQSIGIENIDKSWIGYYFLTNEDKFPEHAHLKEHIIKILDKTAIDKNDLSFNEKVIIYWFITNFIPKKLTPKNFLQDNKLKYLLDIPNSKLIKLTVFLGISELVSEIRKIIDKKQIEQVMSYLQIDEKKYLNKQINSTKEGVLNGCKIIHHIKNKDSLRNRLKVIGTYKLAIAIKNSEESFIWFILHKLPMNLGKEILKILKRNHLDSTKEKIEKEIKTLTMNHINI